MNSWPVRRVWSKRPEALPVTDGDAGRIEANDAAVGDGYAVDIARQILEHGVGAVAPGRAVHDPGLAPHRLGDKEVGALLGERGPELAAHEVCERSSRRQIVGPRRTPAGPVRRHAAAGDEAVHVRMVAPTPTIP